MPRIPARAWAEPFEAASQS